MSRPCHAWMEVVQLSALCEHWVRGRARVRMRIRIRLRGRLRIGLEWRCKRVSIGFK